MESVRDVVRGFILESFLPGEDPKNLTDDTELKESGILDSLSTLKLVSFLEERFKVEFEADDLEAGNLASVEQHRAARQVEDGNQVVSSGYGLAELLERSAARASGQAGGVGPGRRTLVTYAELSALCRSVPGSTVAPGRAARRSRRHAPAQVARRCGGHLRHPEGRRRLCSGRCRIAGAARRLHPQRLPGEGRPRPNWRSATPSHRSWQKLGASPVILALSPADASERVPLRTLMDMLHQQDPAPVVPTVKSGAGRHRLHPLHVRLHRQSQGRRAHPRQRLVSFIDWCSEVFAADGGRHASRRTRRSISTSRSSTSTCRSSTVATLVLIGEALGKDPLRLARPSSQARRSASGIRRRRS